MKVKVKMKMKITYTTIAFFLLFCTNLVTAQTINTEQSSVLFEISNMKFKTVKGTFSGMTGDLIFTPSDLENASFNVCIDAASVDTGSKKRDKHLQKEDFFDVEKYPTICFVSSSVQQVGSTYVVKGQLSMHGVSKEMEIPFTFTNNTFKGEIEVNRIDYKVGGTGTFMVGNETKITIICVMD